MRPTFSQIRNLGDPAFTNTWDLQFLKLPQGVNLTSDDINFRCESVGIPKKNGEKVTIQIRGLPPVHYPGTTIPEGSITFTFIETNNVITELLHKLTEMNQDSETGAGLPKSELEMEIRIVRLNKANKPIWEYHLVGCFMETADPGGELNGGNAEALRPTATFSYDNFYEKALA